MYKWQNSGLCHFVWAGGVNMTMIWKETDNFLYIWKLDYMDVF